VLKINNDILECYFELKNITDICSYGNGHINDTFLITTISDNYILQKVNGAVFNLENLIHNYDQLVQYTESKNIVDKQYPDLVRSKTGKIHSIDKSGNAWRVINFVNNSTTYTISPNLQLSRLTGKTMGNFQLFLNECNPDSFKDTITNFHNPSKRLNDFYSVLNSSNEKLISSAQNDISFAKLNSNISSDMTEFLSTGHIPIRVTHNDTKIDNILFYNNNLDAFVIDLDTIMKGVIAFDFGDMVRSITGLAKEDEKDIERVSFSLSHFKALSEGYLGVLSNSITENEKKSLLPGILSIIYIQGIRFLTDYLAGNIYYKIDYPEHNLVRCRTQFKLLKDILELKDEVQNTIESCLSNN
jgi:Ser/Thr protein kinase RdoA (MazF antagonist)